MGGRRPVCWLSSDLECANCVLNNPHISTEAEFHSPMWFGGPGEPIPLVAPSASPQFRWCGAAQPESKGP